MSIRPVDVNGMIQRTQDIGQLKQHEDNKPVIQQHSIEIQQERKEEQLTKRVNDPEQKENEGYRFDAKEKGNNSYERNQNKKKKKESGLTVVRAAPAHGLPFPGPCPGGGRG